MKLMKSSLFMILLFAVMTIVGLAVTPQYGTPIDEYTEQDILRSNIKEYALRLLNEDNPLYRYYAESSVPRITESIERDHGACAYYPAAVLLRLFENRPLFLTKVWHLYTFVWFMLGVYAVYGFCRETGLTRAVSFLGAFLLYGSPRFFAEGHYNNKDILLLSLFLLVLWSGLRFIKKPSIGRGLLFSLLGAMAANTRIIGVLPWALIGMFFILSLCLSHGWNRRLVGLAMLTVIAFAGFFVILTPATWTGINQYLQYVLGESGSFSRWNGLVLYRGILYNHKTNPLPASYLFYMILVTLPLYTLPLALAGGIQCIRDFVKKPKLALTSPAWIGLCVSAICSVFPIAYAAFSRANVYNGWRHVYFTYCGIVLLGAQGISVIRCFLRKHGGIYGMHHVFAVGLTLFMAFTGFDIVRNLPNEYCYYNLLAHHTAQENLELDYWCVSTQEAVTRLETAQRDTSLPLVLAACDDISRIALEECYKPCDDSTVVLNTVDTNAPYLLYNPTYARIYGLAFPQGYHELYSVKSYQLSVCMILEKDES